MFVLHAGQCQQVVAAEVTYVLQPDAERAHQPVGGTHAGFAATHQLDLQLFGQCLGQFQWRQQAQRQQPHRAVGEHR